MSDLRALFDALARELDFPWMMANTEALWKIELGHTYRDHRRSARFVERLLRQSGLARVERIALPADGKTTFQDKAMPLAWDATVARLTVTKSPLDFDDPVVADFRRHPFHLIRGSVSAPKGGTVVRLITEEQMFAGHDARGAMVISCPETRASGAFIRAVCDLGALGFVNDHVKDRYLTPDGICWSNACTEGSQWHIHDDDRPFIGFSVTPRVGDQLRAAARAGEVLVRVESDARRHAGEVDLVTAVLPGRDRRELWLLSHLYEPLPDDNSTGTVATIEIARALQRMVAAGRLPAPRFTLRLIFGLEMYGFAAYADRRGANLGSQVIGALNMDALAVFPKPSSILLAPAGTPFFGDYVMEELFHGCQGEPNLSLRRLQERGAYVDDMFLSDSTTGVPTIWPLGEADLWHNSAQNMDRLHPECFRKAAAFSAAWIARMLTLEGETLDAQLLRAAGLAEAHLFREAETVVEKALAAPAERRPAVVAQGRKAMAWRRKWEEGRLAGLARIAKGPAARAARARFRAAARRIEADLRARLQGMAVPARAAEGNRSVWHRIGATIVPRRATVGLPYDLRRVPKAERRRLPGNVLYGPFARFLSNMDGRKTLEELVQEAAWESGQELGSKQVREYIGAVEYLTEHGYLKTRFLRPVRRGEIVLALRRVGVRRGDLLMLHSGLAALGHIEGGPDTVIAAVLETLGPKGTLLMPAFSRSEISVGGSSLCLRAFRPYHPLKSLPWIGRTPGRFMQHPGALRSAHPTHSVVGLGPLAEECLREHREDDAPVCRRSPFGKLIDHDGKMAWLGADLASTTFLHLLEDEARLPYLADALCRVERADGSLETVRVPRYLPGHRDFYRQPAEETKVFRRLLQDGLEVRRTPLGFGDVKLIRARPMYDLGMAALRQEPTLMLCDDPACLFCRSQMQATAAHR